MLCNVLRNTNNLSLILTNINLPTFFFNKYLRTLKTIIASCYVVIKNLFSYVF